MLTIRRFQMGDETILSPMIRRTLREVNYTSPKSELDYLIPHYSPETMVELAHTGHTYVLEEDGQIIGSGTVLPDGETEAEIVAAFLARYDPTVPQLADLKTAVSEAVTNCIVHAYPDRIGPVTLCVAVYPEREVHITVTDKGVGIPDVPQAMEPLFTTGNPEERSGLGFAVMQSFMDRVKVTSRPGKGTKVVLIKRLSARAST